MIRYKNVFTGSICNNDCTFCPNPTPRTARSRDEILEDIGRPEGAVDSLALYGGEPTLREDLVALLAEARSRGWRRFKLVTNGVPLGDQQRTLALLDAGVLVFEVKLYGHAPELHDALTGRRGSLYETIQGLVNVRSAQVGAGSRPFLHFRVGVTAANYPHLSQILVFGMQLEADRFTFRLEDPSLSLAEAGPYIKRAMDTGMVNSLWTQTERVPLCLMDGYEHHVREAFAPAEEERLRVQTCAECAFQTCDGAWKPYVDAHPSAELLPVLASRQASTIRGAAT